MFSTGHEIVDNGEVLVKSNLKLNTLLDLEDWLKQGWTVKGYNFRLIYSIHTHTQSTTASNLNNSGKIKSTLKRQ